MRGVQIKNFEKTFLMESFLVMNCSHVIIRVLGNINITSMTKMVFSVGVSGGGGSSQVTPSILSGFPDSLPVLIYTPGWREAL